MGGSTHGATAHASILLKPIPVRNSLVVVFHQIQQLFGFEFWFGRMNRFFRENRTHYNFTRPGSVINLKLDSLNQTIQSNTATITTELEVNGMSLIRWQPFQEIETLQRDMNRLFDRLMATDGDRNGLTFAPAAELEETADTIHLKLEIPGMDAKDIDVQVSAEAVSIKGERKEETRTEEKGMTRTEFRYGKFQRMIPLPARVENTNAKAEYKNGILHLTLPKAEDEKNKVVKVNIG
jgi:HSP20 family protein